MIQRWLQASGLKWILLGIILCSNVWADTINPNARFRLMADQYFDHEYFPDQPTLATQLVIHDYDHHIEDYSAQGINQLITVLRQYEQEFLQLSGDMLDEQNQADRQLIIHDIRSRLFTFETLRPWKNNPDFYSSGIADSAFVLAQRSFAPADVRLRALIAREKQMPRILQQAQLNLSNPPSIYTRIAIEQLPGIIQFFQRDLPATFKSVRDPSLQHEFAVTNKAVVSSLQQYLDWLRRELLPKSHGDYRIGKQHFEQKLRYDEMVDIPLERLKQIGWDDLHKNQRKFDEVAHAAYPGLSREAVLAKIYSDRPHREGLLDAFKATFDKLIGFIHTHHIITIPSDVRPIMEETPPFLRSITFASMDVPGPFEKTAKEAFFNVTLPELTWPVKKQHEFLSQFNYPSINSISIHEAYPGHYVQFLWMHQVHDRVRQILGSRSNAEGWAHYCEQMMLDEGLKGKTDLETKRLRLGELLNALLRDARFIVGIEMHTGDMSFNDAIHFFMREAYLPGQAALVETKRGTSDPTYLYYTLGKLQIMKLRADIAKQEGAAFNLQRFHDDFMRQGFPPISIVRKALLHDDSPTL